MSKVSIVIPTFNRAHYLPDAIRSVLDQSYKNWELIVVDDGSTDNTQEVLSAYKDQLVNIYQQNEGRSAARNKGIQVAKGEYIAFLDSDDVWLRDKLARQMTVFEEANSDVSLVHGYKQLVDEELQPIAGAMQKLRRQYRFAEEKMETYETYIQHACIFTSTIVVKKTALLEVDGYDCKMSSMEDLDLYLRLLAKEHAFDFISEPPLILYRWHGDNTGGTKSNLGYLEVYKKHLEICERFQCPSSIRKAKTLLYQAIAQTHYRLNNFRQVRLYWFRALLESTTTLGSANFWRQVLRINISN